jgi:hypothetical protein
MLIGCVHRLENTVSAAIFPPYGAGRDYTSVVIPLDFLEIRSGIPAKICQGWRKNISPPQHFHYEHNLLLNQLIIYLAAAICQLGR